MLGTLLIRLRGSRRVADVAAGIGVSEAALYFWEAGNTRPSQSRLVALMDFYGATTADRAEVASVYTFGAPSDTTTTQTAA